jgi:quinol monooxygenase YgiN
VYNTDEAPADHKDTAHYQLWRDTVADWMAEPRTAVKSRSIFPLPGAGWDCSNIVEAAQDQLLAVHVNVTVKEGMEEAFKKASISNAKESIKEPGIARFDVIQVFLEHLTSLLIFTLAGCMQNIEMPNKFILVEVYKTDEAPADHKDTAHYQLWRDTVADWMAEPRTAVKSRSIFPPSCSGWDSVM